VDDLTAFVRARLDEREAKARKATPGPWRWVDPGGESRSALVGPAPWKGEWQTVLEVRTQQWPSRQDAAFIADNDPEFVLADVAAKRQILEQYELADGGMTGQILRNCLDTPIRLLALPFAGHPDYREEWKP
jgi:hypothetical protein